MKRAGVAALLLASVATGCSLGPTAIKEILDNPAKYDGKVVSVEGDVVDSANLLVLKFYSVQDATGKIAVVTKRSVPRPGAHVSVQGTVHQAFSLGNDQLTVIVESAEQ